MAAVKSKSGIYCSSKSDDGAQRMNITKMSFGIFDIIFVLFSIVTFIADLSTGEKRYQVLLFVFVSCIRFDIRLLHHCL